MAYNSNPELAGLAGIIGAAVGGYMGYNQAAAVGMEPLQGALILGGAGLVLGSAGAFILKSVMQFVIYVIMLGVIAYFLQGPIEKLTGVNPAKAAVTTLRGWGIPLPDSADKLVKETESETLEGEAAPEEDAEPAPQ
jgi:hypothetical protein